VRSWLADARARGLRAVRTGALFPRSIPAFLEAGFVTTDRLVLLRLDLTGGPRQRRRGPVRTRRLGGARLADAAAVDQAAFRSRPGAHDGVRRVSEWCNDAASLAAIGTATPQHRSRIVVRDGQVVGFAISGRAARRGYLQRLAVVPDAQRQGLGRALVVDSLAWMQRNRVGAVLVNTELDNAPAIALYESVGFLRQPGELSVLERALLT
jgi:ribosomal protein S18 acetylase RimI-like enzyme